MKEAVDSTTTAVVDLELGEVVRFEFPPGVPHAIRNTGGQPQVILSFNDQPHDPASPDVTAVPLL